MWLFLSLTRAFNGQDCTENVLVHTRCGIGSAATRVQKNWSTSKLWARNNIRWYAFAEWVRYTRSASHTITFLKFVSYFSKLRLFVDLLIFLNFFCDSFVWGNDRYATERPESLSRSTSLVDQFRTNCHIKYFSLYIKPSSLYLIDVRLEQILPTKALSLTWNTIKNRVTHR